MVPWYPQRFLPHREESFCPCWAEIWPHAASLPRETWMLVFHQLVPMSKFFWGGRLSISVVEAVLFCTEKFISVCQRDSLWQWVFSLVVKAFRFYELYAKLCLAVESVKDPIQQTLQLGIGVCFWKWEVWFCVSLGKDRAELKSCHLCWWHQYLSGGLQHPFQIQDRVVLGSGTKSPLAWSSVGCTVPIY